ncbi:glycoside hydrolase family 65 protein [Antarcticibacterium flavum]|uniref:Glycoside hydrolase family 65 protein n=1 Tax=Antarcticibacterium flavum TaxID=2058175 RepID=A0A5B7X5G8_9FLAO|nr:MULTISPECIES: glycosyl hydrolase family 65 protein [Antarcticibacterium]MCM4159687.1 trehalose 6-phosphate phosphorylase [Antarcticibacterium sp. W02-3]QCY70627.1 glycoside hydrolase family 65 protein [Antarcticibacterium flavum]
MDTFCITYNNWNPKKQKLREALCTLGNGYFGTRGAAEESSNDSINYPGTYLAGGFNRAKTKVGGRDIENEDLVNFPNWLCLSFRPGGGKWLNLEEVEILEYQQVLQMRKGILERKFSIKDQDGRITRIHSRRLVSMQNMHLAGIQWHLTPVNWSGELEIRTALDGTVINDNVARYRELESTHLKPLGTQVEKNNILVLQVQTTQSRLTMAQAARTRLFHKGKEIRSEFEANQKEGYIEQLISFKAEEGEKYNIEKIVAIHTSRDRAVSEPSQDACQNISRAGNFQQMLKDHIDAYKFLWHRGDIGVIGNKKIQQLTRLHIFHNFQTISLNTIGLDVGVPSRGLHGEAYRGHIFWDELYIFPFLNLRLPEVTRSLLMYRYYRLEEARHAAKKEGYRGAMFPWQSGSNGREESQILHLNPESGNWIPDNTHLQRHVNSAIAYNIWNYFIATDDKLFLSHFGAEMFLNIAKFWASKTTFNKKENRYEIHKVVGPDEYHTTLPGSSEQGLNNNAYTNVMAAWVLQKALEILELIKKSRKRELLGNLTIGNDELTLWKEISEKMYVPFLEEGIISQFDGYEGLQEFPWEEYRNKYNDIQRLDRILEKEGDTVNKYKASKQADVLMLFYLFSRDELQAIFKKLGIKFTEEQIKNNVQYYKERTSHGSTLSRLVFSWILSKFDEEMSWENFEKLIVSDFEDIQGGTTPEGIHLGAMAGSLDLIQRNFAGLEVGDHALWINPRIPPNIKAISMRVNYRNHWIYISVDKKKLKISFEEGWSNEVKIGVIDTLHTFQVGEAREFKLSPSRAKGK